MTATRRLSFRCCNPACGRTYELTFELKPDIRPKLNVQCPFCGTRGTVTLNPYRIIEDNTITRKGEQQGAGTAVWDFPELVPVEAVED